MRDALNLSFLPMVQDEMDGLSARSCVKGYAPNVSNGYYGYQPVVARRKDEERTHEPEQMDVSEAVHCENSEACPRETRSHNGRKRAWHSEDAANFKRRRENDVRQQFDRRKMWDVKFYNGSRESSKFLEELLRGTHGSDLYNWTGEDL